MTRRIPDSENGIGELLQAERADSFAPYFGDRVMKRVQSLGLQPAHLDGDSLYETLKWVFVRAAVVGLVLIIAVGLMNALEFGSADAASWVDSLLGLPSDELADMLTYEMI